MKAQKIIVLKFGSSVLRTPDDAPLVAHEVYRWVRDGWRVIAIVSALEGETDQLLSQAQRWEKNPHAAATALLASTGELRSAALLTLALDRAGIDAQVLDVAAIGLRTSGARTLDSKPLRVNAPKLRRLLKRFPVLVLPGFLGRDSIGRTTLLGRGGSDCSALFLAHHLGARCRLVKDVDGLYEWDPQIPGSLPRKFRQLSWDDAHKLDGGIVQHKAIEMAKHHGQDFEVASLYRRDATQIGERRISFCDKSRRPLPTRVVLLGLGHVGRGVFEALSGLPDWFQVVGVAVRDKSRAADVPDHLLHDQLSDAIEVPCDVVVELIGDCEPACRSIRRVLQRGTNVITANKRLVALFGQELESLAQANDASIRWSAAVGGAVPLLEQLARLSPDDPAIAIRGVLNGTTNYVLDRWQSGLSFQEALAEARVAGFAEADASRDLDGLDAADKLVLVHRQITGQWLHSDDVQREPLNATRLRQWESGPRPTIRQVASWSIRANQNIVDANPHDFSLPLVGRAREGGHRLRVSIVALPQNHPLARLKLAENGALLRTARGARLIVRGKGAGRWPTTEAVLSDLFDVAARIGSPRQKTVALTESRSFAEVTS